ncbi:MAG: hypothetical protein M0C28_44375 [Candidatus Moduliflexus flocculans]|nr:hypothetical protein [Candidatus Moduliflexus flocculans]
MRVAVIVQMIRIQNSPKQASLPLNRAISYACEFRTFYPDRGEIYDRNGHLLAGNKTVYEVGVNLTDDEGSRRHRYAAVSVELGRDYDQVHRRHSELRPKAFAYVVLAGLTSDAEHALSFRIEEGHQEQAEEGVPAAV